MRAENIRLTVWHTNDIHGWIMSREASYYKENPKRIVGGGAVFAKVMAQEKGPRLLLDAGDWFQGTPEGSLTQGKAVADVFNALGYDALTVGNHEFDYGADVVKALLGRIKAPVVCANIYDAKTGERVGWVKPWVVKEVAGAKVGIFGLLTTKMGRLVPPKQTKGLEFRREIDEAKLAVSALKKEGATVIIALSHLGFENPDGSERFDGDQTLAASVPGIDLIVGGHSHTRLKDPVRDATYGTLIVQTGSGLTMAGKVTLEIDPKTRKVVKSDGRLIDLWVDEFGEDPKVGAVVSKYMDEVGKAMEVVVATAATPFPHDRKASIESPLGDWMTDCMRDWARTDMAFQNPGGIRSSIAAGPVTLRTLFNVMPFDNVVVNLTMTGAQVQEVLEQGAKEKSMLQMSGASVVYDPAKPKGERIVSANVSGKELKRDAVYVVSTVDFLVDGGDGYDIFKSVEKKEFTGKLVRDIMMECAKKQGSMSAPALGRIQTRGN
ncbi:MAG: bifunctional metallophosphatase/5'-nucleotidase [Elusimicrobia bacterium]|nr:bifunctional metallophosphatase/5'-nucleotidase [Elusimicrobiota bacterium]